MTPEILVLTKNLRKLVPFAPISTRRQVFTAFRTEETLEDIGTSIVLYSFDQQIN